MIDNQGVRKFIAQCQNEGDGIVVSKPGDFTHLDYLTWNTAVGIHA